MKKLLLVFLLVSACDDIIEVPDISDKTVTILAPTDEAVLDVTNVNFSWNSLEDADNYTLQIATPNFDNAAQIVLDSTVTATSFSQMLLPNTYQWRIRAQNSDYQTAFATQGFMINTSEAIDISNEQVILLSPAENVTLTIGNTNFSWDTVLGADLYVLQIATPNFEQAIEILENTTTTMTSLTVIDLPANTYQWRVKAVNADSETSNTTQNFTIEEN